MCKHLSYILPLSLIIVFSGCTKNFQSINTNPSAITTVGSLELPFMFSNAESSAGINRSYYQTVQNLYADLYAQYFASSTTSFETDRYVMNDGWLQRPGIIAYVQVVPQLKTIMDNSDSTSGEYALASIMWVYAFHRLTDYFGPVPYFGAGEAKDTIPYDDQKSIYLDFFARLNAAVVHLKQLSTNNVFGSYDIIYGGDVQQWIRFANTLRLRLALRISNVMPDQAKTEAEAAVAGGVMTDISHTAWLQKTVSGGDGNGLAQVASYNEFSMSSTMASYLKGYNDPRLSVYFQPAIASGLYRSVRNGSSPVAINNPLNTPDQTSNVGTYWAQWTGTTWVPEVTASLSVMYAAEAYFLRAEGALNGWNMDGNAEDLYNQGITTAMQQWGITDATTINNYIQSSAVPVAPGDVQGSPAVANVPVKWGGSEAVQRQQVGTQKWLAIYPDGLEGWAEFRRSGYPTMYPVLESDNTDLPPGTFIKRLPYPSTEASTNAVELDKGIQLLGGPDKPSTPLWWDVN